MSTTLDQNQQQTVADILPIDDIDYLEFYVGNAKQAAYWYCKLFGFDIVAFSGLETGNRDRVSYVLRQGDITFVISGSFSPDHEITDFVRKHGDGVKDIAMRVDNVEETFRKAVANGGVPIQEPWMEEDEHGQIKKAVIGTLGDVVHTLIERNGYQGAFAPGFQAVNDATAKADHSSCLTRIDHLALNVPVMQELADYYEKVFGFTMLREFSKDEVSSDNSSLMTKAMQNGTEKVKFPIVEPAPGKKKSQVSEYLEYNGGPGVQHIALLTDDIIQAVDNLQKNGIKFLFTPDMYYELMPERVGEIDEPIDELNRLNILVDRDDEGYLLQIFGHPIHDRPTLFFEIIQRKGAKGFGNGNIRALFEAVEREQERRGNL